MDNSIDMHVAGYHLTECIGTDRTGHIYLATVESDGKPLPRGSLVAIRLLFPQVSHLSGYAELHKQIVALAAKINHQNVCRVLEDGEDNGQQYVVTEYIHGMTLEDWMKDRLPLSSSQTIEILSQLCGALVAASNISSDGHKKDLVHRDLHPRNILLQTSVEDEDEARPSIHTRVKVLGYDVAKEAAGLSKVF